jgi:hypothetical protein
VTTWDLAAIRPYLEAGYFIAGILVLLGLLLASRQLSLLRLDINLRNERAAKEKAIVACERYLDSYVQKSGLLHRERTEKKTRTTRVQSATSRETRCQNNRERLRQKRLCSIIPCLRLMSLKRSPLRFGQVSRMKRRDFK